MFPKTIPHTARLGTELKLKCMLFFVFTRFVVFPMTNKEFRLKINNWKNVTFFVFRVSCVFFFCFVFLLFFLYYRFKEHGRNVQEIISTKIKLNKCEWIVSWKKLTRCLRFLDIFLINALYYCLFIPIICFADNFQWRG